MRIRLSLLMALIYAMQGAFWPLLAVHLRDLGISGFERGWIFATFAIASVAMPLGAGQLVDRFMAAERLLALIFTVATGFLIAMAAGLATGAWSIFALFMIFWMVTAPAFALSNTVTLRHMQRPHRDFGKVRLWGTIGWMGVGWLVSLVMVLSGNVGSGRGAFEAFWVAAAIAVILAVYSLTLPHTPPLINTDARPAGFADALRLARRPGMGVFLITALCVHMTTPFLYQMLPTYFESKGLPRSWISTVLTLGQWPEIAMLVALPWMLDRIGPKGTLSLGIAAWVVRYGSLALDPPLWLGIAGVPLHGVGIACFTVAGQVYMDSQADPDRRASAQALYMVVTSGIGSLLGSLLAGDLVARYAGDYARVFLVPCVIDVALLVYFWKGFRASARVGERAVAPNTVRPLRDDAVRGPVVRVGNLVTEPADG